LTRENVVLVVTSLTWQHSSVSVSTSLSVAAAVKFSHLAPHLFTDSFIPSITTHTASASRPSRNLLTCSHHARADSEFSDAAQLTTHGSRPLHYNELKCNDIFRGFWQGESCVQLC